jgi:Xaa-Pro aminopeptidase
VKAPSRLVVVLADDLIWGARLTATIGAVPGYAAAAARTLPELEARLGPEAPPVIVDLTARTYDGVAAVEAAAARGSRVLAVGQHDDHVTRSRALAAGAERVYAYRKLFEDGPATLARWLEAGAERAARRTSRPSIPGDRYGARLTAAAAAARTRGIHALLIGVGADVVYLTGYAAMPLERLTMLVLPAAAGPRLIVPRLEVARARACPAAAAGLVDVVTWDETDDPHALAGTLAGLPVAGGRVGVSQTLWALHVLALQRALPGVSFELATNVTRELRMRKDADEIALLRLAAEAADRVIAQVARGRLIGRTEAQVAREVRERLIAEGHDEANFAIVGSGPNSASPHHEASDRVIEAGEPIVIDIGGSLGGYASDVTRTLWVSGGDPARGPDEAFRHLFGVLRAAQERATAAVRPGLACEAVDAVARDLITAEGYGPQFFHRVGHGIGLEGHEEPFLVAGNSEPLDVGFAFSVEPGIYLEGRYGARIEDVVVCGQDGPIVLNQASRDLWVVDG